MSEEEYVAHLLSKAEVENVEIVPVATLLRMAKTLLDRLFLRFDGFKVPDAVYLDAIGTGSRRADG